ncbi:lipase [Rhypophila decipiens]|uniref:Lipase n=1 Tax=Rhypophila decipiens TaxID=261697 RepID=A0AAN6YGY4_9PEZI|nr:lipase [Rhypophila decipiens]
MLSLSTLLILWLTVACRVSSTILQNGQVKPTSYANTLVSLSSRSFTTYPANATEISYQGRWDSKHVSWWSAPGLRFGYTGQTVAISFGNWTSNGVLVAYRIAGLDWMFTNVTTGGTHLLVSPTTPGSASYPRTFELRVTNWALGVQIDAVHVAPGEKLVKLPQNSRRIEFIGDSLTSGMFQSYEGLSGWAYGLGAGLGNTDYSVTAYPGVCAADQNCWGNPRGQVHQWFYTSDTSSRAYAMYGDKPEPWDFSKRPDADLVFVCIGTNDCNAVNNVTSQAYTDALIKIIQGVHGKWPNSQIVVLSLWLGFYKYQNWWYPSAPSCFEKEVYQVYQSFNTEAYLQNPTIYDGMTKKTSQTGNSAKPFVHYFNTTGIMQHNDINPGYHLTDVGSIKIASQLQQYVKLQFGWEFQATGPEVYHDTTYWNDEATY